jgi:serine phosphatase RsbU (regulator of sigma subunit)
MLFFFPAQHEKSLLKYFNQEIQNLANTVSLGIRIALTEENFEGVQMAMDYAKSDSRLIFATVMQIDTIWEEDSSSYKVEKTIISTYPEGFAVSTEMASTDSIIVKASPFTSEIMKGQVVVGFTTEEITKTIASIKKTSIIASLAIIVVGLLLGLALARKISLPVVALRNAATKVGAGDLNQQVSIGSNDEIGELGTAFNIMVDELSDAEDKIKKKNETLQLQNEIIEQKNLDITYSINYAQKIQEAILPSKSLIDKRFSDYFVLFEPKEIVSGDFYWIAEAKDSGNLEKEERNGTDINSTRIVTVCDCTGHGVPGALVSMIASSVLRETVYSKGITEPAQILDSASAALTSALNQTRDSIAKDGMDAAICAIDYGPSNDNRGCKLQFSGAHNPMYLVRKESPTEVEVYKGDFRSVGFAFGQTTKFTNWELVVNKGDRIYLFSDGYIDQFGSEKAGGRMKKFTAKRLQKLLVTIQKEDMKKQKSILHDTMMAWMDGKAQIDDILLFGIEI